MSALQRWLAAAGTVALVALGLSEPVAAQGRGTTVGKIASLQNRVETRSSSAAWAASTLNQSLFDRDRVRTGPASRAAILYSDQTLHRLNEKSEVEVLPPSAGNPGLLRVLSGKHYFSSRTPKDYGRVETPTVTAAIRGTEFVVEVAEDETTTITMLEGTVEASNEHGSLTVERGEQAYVEPGKAPIKRIVVRPRDAVSWTLYYPPVLGGSDAERLRSAGGEGESLARAAELLSAGQVEEAKPLIESARARDARNPVALALASVIALAGDRKEEATALSAQAVAADARSAAAALAASFAAQAAFDIPRARSMAEKAAELDPQSSVAMARAAELRMAEGDLEGARRAAERAVARTPGESRALAVLGFVALAQFRSAEAEEVLERAVAADPSLSLARLGLGIARIRGGSFAAGREEIQTAVILDPESSLLRSYLGKAYYEEKRPAEAAKELAAAKELDPQDPTPWLYDAILAQNENRPVEALDDLREAIARNYRRAVYRSRLLLDQDRAVRGADLARIYNDLGFEQLGLVTARRSADEDQSNHSGHLFLAGNYRNVPDFAPAFLSEVLQARIYQPVSVNAARPDVVNESVSFNEYTSLFDRPRIRGFGGPSFTRTDTDLAGLFPAGALCFTPEGVEVPCVDLVRIDDGNALAGELVGTVNRDRLAVGVGWRKLSNDGFRVNDDRDQSTGRAFVQYAPNDTDTFQLNAIRGRLTSGDLPLRQTPVLVTPERLETELTNVGLGWHRALSPASDLAVSLIYNETEQTGGRLDFPATATATLKGPQLEVQHVLRRPEATWIFGGGGFDGEDSVRSEGPFGSAALETEDRFANGYAYLKLRGLGALEVTAGAAVEHVVAPTGLLPPRDSNILPADLTFSDTRVSPKLGLSWYPGPSTTVRAAAYWRLSPAIGRLQTLEPTQIAGFNQFFDEPGGTRSFSYGAGVDQGLTKNLFAGLSLMRRDLTIPEAVCEFSDPFSGCGFQQAVSVTERGSDDTLGSAYLNATLGKRLSAAVEYGYRKRQFTFTAVSTVGLFQDFVRTRRVRPQLRVHFPFGLFAGVAATRYDQVVHQFDDLSSDLRTEVPAAFWIGDVQVGYRLPRRFGSVVLDARNVTDREFAFYERSIEETVIPARAVTLQVNFAY